MKVTFWKTDATDRLRCVESCEMQYKNTDTPTFEGKKDDLESYIVNVHPAVTYQTIGGMGGTFTDAAATAWSRADDDGRQEVIRRYFDREEGIGYTFGRLSIGSCDFSAGDYTYVREGDETLESFDLAHDEVAIFPMVRAARQWSDELRLFASPWSPPAYMKENGSRIGSRLKRAYYGLWADYLRRYVEACGRAGIEVGALTLQNEPRHHQLWESCQYTPAEEAELLGYVGEALEGSGVRLLCYDHCRERILERATYIYAHENGRYCDGIAHHWYSGTHFGELDAFRRQYPDKLLIASEGCCAIPEGADAEALDLPFAERYARDICGCFGHGVNYYCDFCLALDEKNGPYHNREGRGCYADAPVHIDSRTGEISYRLSYYYIGHYSKFIRPGARVVGVSTYDADMDVLACRNPSGEVVVVLLNRTDRQMPVVLRMQERIAAFMLAAHSIVTAVIEA